jgi:hypothetical protein
MSRLRAPLWLVVLVIPACAMNELGNRNEFAGFVPGVLQPGNCGTPEAPQPCKSKRKLDHSTLRLRPVVLVKELGGAPAVAVATTTLPPGEPHAGVELSSEPPR